MEKEKNTNCMLNFLKGLGCIGVVFIHITFPGVVGTLVAQLSGFAVPIFFMIAGFYSFGCDEKKLKKEHFLY